jgi:hypothetical protein
VGDIPGEAGVGPILPGRALDGLRDDGNRDPAGTITVKATGAEPRPYKP